MTDSITNNKYGLVAGLNCKVIGEDLGILVNSLCVSNFNTFYISRIAMGLVSFGILFSTCFITCVTMRY
jgi:hypothetical protein